MAPVFDFSGRHVFVAGGTSGINLGLFCSTPAVALSRSLAPKHAAEMLLTGEFVAAEQAAAWGLVNRCVDDNCLMQEVQSLADQLASKSRYALASGKRLLRQLRQGQGYPLDAAYQLAAGNMASDMQSGDAQAAVSAGNTGALMALSRYVLKTLEGLDRPAIAGATGPGCRAHPDSTSP